MSQDMSLANVIESVTNKCTEDILKKFQWAIKRVADEHGTNNKAAALTQEELIYLVKAWEPKRDIICLYVRWARQLRRNFNLDSIATLLCLSRQCRYTPVDFIRQVKTLSIQKNKGKSAYGVTFHFDIPNRKNLDRERLNKEFLGLSVTLAFLQEQITDSPSILGKTRMRECEPRKAFPIGIPINESIRHSNKEQATVNSHPNVEFHTQESLSNRIWVSINHRWLALHLTEHIFREPNALWSYSDALVYSFQMMAPCGPGRFEFLSPLAGYCLRFQTHDSIDSKRSQLQSIWNNPSSFMSYGNSCLTQFSEDAQSRIIINCLQDLRSDIPSNSKQISYNKHASLARQWNMIRAYIFHFWLDSASNANLKSLVTSSTSYGKQKRKHDVFDETIQQTTPPTTPVVCAPPAKLAQLPHKPSSGGLRSITSTRRRCTKPTTNDVNNIQVHEFECHKEQANLTATQDVPCQSNNKELDWTSFRLISSQELQGIVQSYLLTKRLDGVHVVSELSPLEVYSADHLHDWVHCRLTARSPYYPIDQFGSVSLQIRQDADCFVDKASKSFHIAREQSPYFKDHGNWLPSMEQIQMLCQAIVSHGTVDSKRAVGQHRLNIGNGGQHWVNGAPCELHGLQFEKDLKKAGTSDVTEVLQTIGRLAEFTWETMCSMQNDAHDHPIAPDSFRKKKYASKLNQYLHMDNEVGFEDLTLVVSSLHPTVHQVSNHKDLMNDTVAGYTRTAAFNMVMINNNDSQPTIIHFQVICNFRKVVGNYMRPFQKYLLPVATHAREYFTKWHRSMHKVFAGKTDKVPTVDDRSGFFLDDTLEYTPISISEEGKHKQSISAEYILTEINVSRTLSLSMFIDPLVKLRHALKFDQTIELALACSFLSNPFWFDWSMSTLIQRLDDNKDSYEIGLHPFYDWSNISNEIFGAWQGGPYNRWSPCGGNKGTVLETFGAQPNATKEARELGEQKLTQIVSILRDHVYWINSMATSCGHQPLLDMPLARLKSKCEQTIKDIASIASCQFSHFRLGILTTILSGCGLLKEGRHLRHLMYPVKGSASFKHLCGPDADFMSRDRAHALGSNKEFEAISNDGKGVIGEEQHDLFMQHLSAELGFQVYFRDEIECILCESHPMRTLNCRDWFRRGMSLYDCNEKGEFFRRAYGRNTDWVKLQPPEHYDFAYLETSPITYIPMDDTLSIYATEFGNQLRLKKVQFKGRSSRTSSNIQLYTNSYITNKETYCPPSIQMADFYLQTNVKGSNIRSMFVLGDGEHAVATSACNTVGSIPTGKTLYAYLHALVPICKRGLSPVLAAGCYHRDSELCNDEVTFFQGHLDKPFVHTAWFIPLGGTPFFTIIALPQVYNHEQDLESLLHFNEWKKKLRSGEVRKVEQFLSEFYAQAKKHMREESLLQLIYLNKCGSVLSFPANRCYHATITPRKPRGFPRDLFIIHPLDGNS